MFIVIETNEEFDGTREVSLRGTFNHFEDAHALMYSLYKEAFDSCEDYDEDWCEIYDNKAIVGEEFRPLCTAWYVFDTDNPMKLGW